MAQLVAVQPDGAVIGSHQADNHIKAGGFARAVGAEQTDYFAAFDIEREILHHLALFEAFAQLFNAEAAVRCGHGLVFPCVCWVSRAAQRLPEK